MRSGLLKLVTVNKGVDCELEAFIAALLRSPFLMDVGRDISVGIAALLRAGRSWDRIPVVGEISHTRPDRPWSPPSPLYNVYRVFPWGRRPVRGVDHPSPSSVEVKERVQLYLYSPFEPSRPVLWWTLPLPWSLFLMDVAPHQRGIGVRRTPVTQWLMPNPIRTHTTKLDSLTKRFSNCGPRTTSGPRVLPFWSF